MQDLDEVKQKIRKIDPALLGEKRVQNDHLWVLIKKIIDLFYCLKNYIYKPKISELLALKEALEARCTAIKPPSPPTDRKEAKVTPSIDSLAISEEEKAQIKKLIPMVAKESISALIKQLGTLLAAKKQMNALHPLKSLEFIFKDPVLRKDMGIMSQNSQRWVGIWAIAKGFRPQTAEKLKEYHRRGSIMPYLPGFCQSIGLNQEQELKIMGLAKEEKWEDFIQTLVLVDSND